MQITFWGSICNSSCYFLISCLCSKYHSFMQILFQVKNSQRLKYLTLRMKTGRSLNQNKPAQKHRMFSVYSRQFSKHSLGAYFRQKDQALIENQSILIWFWAPFSQQAVGTWGPDKLYLIACVFFWVHLELGFLDWEYIWDVQLQNYVSYTKTTAEPIALLRHAVLTFSFLVDGWPRLLCFHYHLSEREQIIRQNYRGYDWASGLVNSGTLNLV